MFILLRRLLLLVVSFVFSILAGAMLVYSCVRVAPVEAVSHIDMELPIYINNSPLLLETMLLYEGPFLEAADRCYVVDVAAVIVYNSGDEDISLVRLSLQCQDQRYYFEGEDVAAGQRVMLLDQSGQIWNKQSPISYSGFVRFDTQKSLVGKSICIEEIDISTLAITNTTDYPLYNLTVKHKQWYKEMDIYMGGQSDNTVIRQILPHETVYIYPANYAADYSKVIRVIS